MEKLPLAAGKTFHIICKVKDQARFAMTRHRRIVATIVE